MKLFPHCLAAAFICLAPAQMNAATLLHAFEFENGLADTLETGIMSGTDASVADGSLNIGAGQGPRIATTSKLRDYSMSFQFQVASVAGFFKVIDYRALASDAGLYIRNGQLTHFNNFANSAPSIVKANTTYQLVVSRSSATSMVRYYLNNIEIMSFIDTAADAVGYRGTIHILKDDTTSSGTQAVAGRLDFLRIYDTAMTPAEIAAIPVPSPTPAPVPLPASLSMLVLGIFGLLGAGTRRRHGRRR